MIAMNEAMIKQLRRETVPRAAWADKLRPVHSPGPSANWDTHAQINETLWAINGGDRRLQDECAAWWTEYFRLPFLRFESFGRIYPLWQAEPALVAYTWAYAQRPNDTQLLEWGSRWLRAFVGYMGIGAAWGPHRKIRDHQKGMKGGLILGDGELDTTGGIFVAWAGARSFSRLRESDGTAQENIGKFHHLDSNGMFRWLEIILGIRMHLNTYEGGLANALFTRYGGVPPWALSAVDEYALAAATNNSLADLKTLASWCQRGPSPQHRYTFVRTESSVYSIAHELPKSSTAALSYCSWTENGICQFLSPESGARASQGSPDAVGATKTWDDGHDVFCERLDRKNGVQFAPLAPGTPVFELRTYPDGIDVWTSIDPVVVPPQTPIIITPTKPKKSWLDKVLDFLFGWMD